MIGDPLPILYKIEDHEFYNTVLSMPFPIPISDMDDNNTIVSQSSSVAGENHSIEIKPLMFTGNKRIDKWLRTLDHAQDTWQVKDVVNVICNKFDLYLNL